MFKVNALMVLFYASLGAVMPYIPLYYRKLGVSGTLECDVLTSISVV